MEKRNIPEIRFKGFSEEWEEEFLNNVSDIYDGTHQTPNYTKTGVKFLSVENISTLDSEKFISQEDFEKQFKVFPEKKDILMTRIGSVGVTNIVKTDEPLAYYVSLALFKPKEINYKYLSYNIQSEVTQQHIWEKTLHVAFPKKINKNEIGKIIISIPLFEEQEKIGQLFESIDKMIEAHRKLIEENKKLKKSLLQKMFPEKGEKLPELRLKGFSGEWAEKRLEEVLIKGSKIKVDNTKIYKRLTVKLNKNGLEEYLPNRVLEDTRPFYQRYKNEIIIGKQNYFNGSIAVVSQEYDGFIASNAIMSFSVNNFNDTLFIFYYISMNDYINRRSHLANGTGQKELSEKEFLNFTINVPSLPEQEAIGKLFKSLDEKIENEEKKLENYKNLKKSLLQKMFI